MSYSKIYITIYQIYGYWIEIYSLFTEKSLVSHFYNLFTKLILQFKNKWLLNFTLGIKKNIQIINIYP